MQSLCLRARPSIYSSFTPNSAFHAANQELDVNLRVSPERSRYLGEQPRAVPIASRAACKQSKHRSFTTYVPTNMIITNGQSLTVYTICVRIFPGYDVSSREYRFRSVCCRHERTHAARLVSSYETDNVFWLNLFALKRRRRTSLE